MSMEDEANQFPSLLLYHSCHTTVYREYHLSETVTGTDTQVNIRNIELVNNPAKYDDEYHFRIKFEAISALAEGTSADGSFGRIEPNRYRSGMETRLRRISEFGRL